MPAAAIRPHIAVIDGGITIGTELHVVPKSPITAVKRCSDQVISGCYHRINEDLMTESSSIGSS